MNNTFCWNLQKLCIEDIWEKPNGLSGVLSSFFFLSLFKSMRSEQIAVFPKPLNRQKIWPKLFWKSEILICYIMYMVFCCWWIVQSFMIQCIRTNVRLIFINTALNSRYLCEIHVRCISSELFYICWNGSTSQCKHAFGTEVQELTVRETDAELEALMKECIIWKNVLTN